MALNLIVTVAQDRVLILIVVLVKQTAVHMISTAMVLSV
jgi:hypothetical protein